MYIELGDRIPGIEYKTRVAAYAVIINYKEEVAVVKTPRACFLPGGGLEAGETMHQCIGREMLEETGFEFKATGFIGCTAAYEFSPRIKKYIKGIGYFFTGEIGKELFEKKEPDHDLIWLNCEEAIGKLILPHQAWAVEEAVKRKSTQGKGEGSSIIGKISSLCNSLIKSWSDNSSTTFSFDNPAAGQCGVTALVVNDYMKGQIYKTSTPKGWHFYNFIEDNVYDFTAMQFEEIINYDNILSSREEVLDYSTKEQYEYLKAEVNRNMNCKL